MEAEGQKSAKIEMIRRIQQRELPTFKDKLMREIRQGWKKKKKTSREMQLRMEV